MILADKIIYLRKRAEWSQEELAEKMGVPSTAAHCAELEAIYLT